jgi:hypothetical protein
LSAGVADIAAPRARHFLERLASGRVALHGLDQIRHGPKRRRADVDAPRRHGGARRRMKRLWR